ncbi:MAG: CpsB/CapC family capsule biosynthesis tyrosine phosphatase [Thermogemmata sp.]|jgi:protein-tyrosine phosphatase|uniref:protein-tyrosine-phosphatase n=1 Tax=Thermogemmata fonticola TaxID=2755323 RepID=A0A7V8VGS2_9BACT|nr:CpsB/CapC family capsule biosynthesis tyrosine phosphatase [Thermogemmata fonticola]MBA2227605.1 protein tyrosine phosphatase [Thermogemmata fonticola]MCX8140926.1 protein tyrosine phosphatase [Gemmataceae bacterium]
MVPFADTHVHLLPGRDDGPLTVDEALAMCRMLVSEGVRHAAALAHQNASYPDNDAAALRTAVAELQPLLQARQIPLTLYPAGEIMLGPEFLDQWKAGRYLTLGDSGQTLLVEMPHGQFLDLLPLADYFRPLGIRLIVAHAERYPELLYDPDLAQRWIAAGCLFQVTTQALAEPWDATTEHALKDWAVGGFIHLLGSDGHGIDRRRPLFREGYQRLVQWVGRRAAERIASFWGIAALQGLPLHIPPPRPPRRTWFHRLFG